MTCRNDLPKWVAEDAGFGLGVERAIIYATGIGQHSRCDTVSTRAQDCAVLRTETTTMPITCNIDTRGKNARFVLGAFVESIGVLLGVLWFLSRTPEWTIYLAAAIWIMGIFILFEALVGWCAVRALGVKTPF